MRCQNSVPLFALAVLYGGAALPLLRAQDIVDEPWSQVCKAAHGRQIRLTTNSGDTVEGYCLAVSVDEISLRTPDQRAVKVAKSAMARMVLAPQPHQLQALRRGVHQSLKTGFRALLTPMAPAGIALIPATLAWGAAAAPFCAIGDLFAGKSKETEIRPH